MMSGRRVVTDVDDGGGEGEGEGDGDDWAELDINRTSRRRVTIGKRHTGSSIVQIFV